MYIINDNFENNILFIFFFFLKFIEFFYNKYKFLGGHLWTISIILSKSLLFLFY